MVPRIDSPDLDFFLDFFWIFIAIWEGATISTRMLYNSPPSPQNLIYRLGASVSVVVVAAVIDRYQISDIISLLLRLGEEEEEKGGEIFLRVSFFLFFTFIQVRLAFVKELGDV